MRQVEGYIAELRCDVKECLGCGNLVVGGPNWCITCVRRMEAPRQIFGVTAAGWMVVFISNLICAAAAVGIALLI